MQHERASTTLKVSGFTAEIETDRFVHGAFQLVVDGTPQSHVNMLDPSDLFFEYIRRIGHVIDLVAEPGQPITAVHLGAGAFTLPRYIEETRPGSQQQVIELESELVDLVRRELPLPRRANIRVRHGDARDVVAKLPAGLRGACDLVVVDIFSGARTPAHVTSREFYELLLRCSLRAVLSLSMSPMAQGSLLRGHRLRRSRACSTWLLSRQRHRS